MKLHTRKTIVEKGSKRVGRGYGSGKGGHNSGRGSKGQKARNHVPAYFVGSSWVWFKRLPFIRGKSKFAALQNKISLQVTALNALPAGSVVNPESLYKAGLIGKNDARTAVIKVIGKGKINHKLTLEVAASESAAKSVSEAGGEIRAQNS